MPRNLNGLAAVVVCALVLAACAQQIRDSRDLVADAHAHRLEFGTDVDRGRGVLGVLVEQRAQVGGVPVVRDGTLDLGGRALDGLPAAIATPRIPKK